MRRFEIQIELEPATFWLEPEGQPFMLRAGDVLALEDGGKAEGHPAMEVKQGPDGLWITLWQAGGEVLLNGQRIWLCGDRY